jgi:undecaprenyl-diphosphatase
MVLLSAWWVKGLVIGGLAGAVELRRRVLPWTFLWASVALLLAWSLSSLIKGGVDRARPPLTDGGIHAVGGVPNSSSFPSGHAATAFAAATVVAILMPRLRTPVLALAALVAFSRVYLGVHFLSDVLAGAVLGIVAGLLVSAVGLRLARRSKAGPVGGGRSEEPVALAAQEPAVP